MSPIQKRLTLRRSKLKELLPFGIALAFVLLITSLMKFFQIQFNATPSMPIGFYQKLSTTLIHRGDIVMACLPINIAKVGLERGYFSKGNCPGSSIAVLKEVIAVPHDTVTLTSKAIIVNSKRYYAPQQKLDPLGYLVKKWIPNMTYRDIHRYWLYGNHAIKNSWDSRYYGGIQKINIHGVYQPLNILTFSTIIAHKINVLK